MNQLHPKAVWLFFISSFLRLFIVFIFLGFQASILLSEIGEKDTGVMGYVGWFLIIMVFLIVLLFIWAKLSYRFYKYELTDDGFRKELGVIYKKYVTIPYDRIQNVDIYRGILARILGLSDLNIQTAGASAQMSRYGGLTGGAEGRLPGLSREDAEKLRDELIRRAKQSKNQGL
ncbi:MAG: PH domain-containing protein [bacterium]|nr:PH domain-containing protein [bacterium]